MNSTSSDDQAAHPEVVDLLSRIGETGPLWGCATSDLNATFLSWNEGHVVASHKNDEVDVIMVVLQGEGTLIVDGQTNSLKAGSLGVIPKGTEREILAQSTPFAYLNVHRRRSLSLGQVPESLRSRRDKNLP